ncbi:MAG: YmdB family metallophosphoesterase [Spirochaetaceae bacterium]|jgi:metallophosphoesterase (TIGR00282 family)|nr:YmdB family metallophosphoesterase [Spirochaetaceae bacterium]
MSIVRALMIGDIVGEGGLLVLERLLPGLIAEYTADFVVVNGENAAGGFGMTEETLRRILAAGADAVTSGNHVWEKRDFWPFLESEARMLRPANYPGGTPGRGVLHTEKAGVSWAVINLQGRELMVPIDCPFRALESIVNRVTAPSGEKTIILVDFHAESAREKEALGYFIDGRASLVAGTHTHVQTADERILPLGSAYITDLGMTGVSGGVIGMDSQICLDRARTQILYRMEPARPAADGGLSAVMGVAAEIDRDTGRALSVARVFRSAASA